MAGHNFGEGPSANNYYFHDAFSYSDTSSTISSSPRRTARISEEDIKKYRFYEKNIEPHLIDKQMKLELENYMKNPLLYAKDILVEKAKEEKEEPQTELMFDPENLDV